jgi:hypothetical protein
MTPWCSLVSARLTPETVKPSGGQTPMLAIFTYAGIPVFSRVFEQSFTDVGTVYRRVLLAEEHWRVRKYAHPDLRTLGRWPRCKKVDEITLTG